MEQRDTEMGHFVEKNKTQNENRQGNKKMKHMCIRCWKRLLKCMTRSKGSLEEIISVNTQIILSE